MIQPVIECTEETDFTNKFTYVSDLSYSTAVRWNGRCRKRITFSIPFLGPQFMNIREYYILIVIGHSQWPRGLRHELSSPARTLGSWVRILLEAWIYVCVVLRR
jgi:hypothetical protein